MFLKKIKAHRLFILLFLFFLSRIIFITTDPVMFDSQEYINRLSEPNLLNAIISGHIPYHAGYIIFFWPISQLAKILNLNSLYIILFSQSILATFSIYYFYKTIKILSDGKIAFLSAIIASLIPIYWIANVTLMMETVYVSFFIFSIYLLVDYLKKDNRFSLLLSSIFFGFAFLAQFSLILWLPFVVLLVVLINKKINFKIIFYYLISLTIFGLLNTNLVSVSFYSSFHDAFISSYLGHKGDIPIDFSTHGILVYLRNFLIPLLRNNTILLVFLAFISLLKLYVLSRKKFWLFFLFIIPSIFLNQAWDSLFFGRHSLLVGFGFAVLVAMLLKKRTIFYCILILYLLIGTVPQLFLLHSTPYLVEVNYLRNLPKGLLIRSHFERPYIENSYNGESINTTDGGLEKTIDEYLNNNQKVFLTSASITDPYGLYSGPYLHNLSLSYRKSYLLESVLAKYSLREYKKINEKDNLIIYRIEKKEKSSYPEVKNMKSSRRRLDYFDPITQIWLFINNFL